MFSEPLHHSGPTAGLSRLVKFLTQFTSEVHGRRIPDSVEPPRIVSGTSTPSSCAASGTNTPNMKPSETMEDGLGDTGVGEVLVGAAARAMARAGVATEVPGVGGHANVQAPHGEVPWRVSVGNGCQDLLNKAFQTLLNPGDPILVETVSCDDSSIAVL